MRKKTPPCLAHQSFTNDVPQDFDLVFEEKMSKQGDAAYAWFLKGYNCSQSVVAAFAPQLGLTEEMALRLSAGFGAGIGRMREVCGAFCLVLCPRTGRPLR